MGDSPGPQCAAQVVCRVALGASDNQGVAVHLGDYPEQTAGGFIMALLVDGPDKRQNVPRLNSVDVLVAENREYVLLQAEHDRAPVLFGKIACACLMPFLGDVPEGLRDFSALRLLGGFFERSGVNAFVQEPPGFHALFPSPLQGDARILAKAEQFCFMLKSVVHPPVLPADRGAVQVQTAAVSELYGFVGSFEGSDLGVGERQGYSLVFKGRKDTRMDKNIFLF